MKNTFKKLLVLCLAIVTALSFSIFMVSCGDKSQSGAGNGGSTLQLIQFSETNVNMIVGDEKYVTATANDTSSGVVIKYSSSNEAIASVDANGKVTANGKGKATITASYSSYKATCTVNVSHGNLKPSLSIDNLDSQDTIVVAKGHEYSLNPYVVFNGKKFTNAKFTYDFSGKSISINASNGVVKGLTKGSTEVTVSASWDGVSGISSMSKTIIIKVTNFVEIMVNKGEGVANLYNMSIPTLNGNTASTVDFNITARDEKGEISAQKIQVEVTKGQDVISYANGKVSSLGVLGSGIITITVTDFEGDVHTKEIEIPVVRAVGDYMANGEYISVDFDTLTGNGINVASIFGSNATITDAYLEDIALEVKGNKIVSGIQGTAFGTPEPVYVTVYSADRGYTIKLIPYVYKNAKEYSSKVEFSTYHGELPLDEIFGRGSKINQAYLRTADGEKQLTVNEDGTAIFGIDSGSKPTEFSIAVASDKEMKIINITAYTLIVKEMSDFAYFTVKPGSWSYKPNQYTIYSGLDWNGYYVLANDIDAYVDPEDPNAYKHVIHPAQTVENNSPGYEGQMTTGQGFYYQHWGAETWGWSSFCTLGANFWESKGANWMGVEGKGLTGTFDGRGYTIYNYSPSVAGLLGFVNGGIVKNVGFKNLHISGYGNVAGIAFNGAAFENMYLETTETERTIKNVWAGSVLVDSIAESCTCSNLVINVLYKGQAPVGPSYGIIASSQSSYGTGYSNVFLIADNPLFASYSGGKLSEYVYDAEFVNGKPCDNGSITVPGVKRYDNLEDIIKDKKNNQTAFESFNTDYWTILGDSLPVFTSCIKAEDVQIYVNDELAEGVKARVFQNQSNRVNIRYQGMEFKSADAVTVVSGPATANGASSVTGNSTGTAELSVKFSVGSTTVTKTITVNVVPAVKEYSEKLQFSALHGTFMDEDFNEISIDEVFGASDVELFAAYDSNNNQLDIETEGKILGFETSKEAPVDGFIDLYTATEAYRISVTAYSLVIKSVEDFKYFVVNEDFGYPQYDEDGKVSSWEFDFKDGDFEFDGYYILANDIDASGYTHNVQNGHNIRSSFTGNYAWQKDIYNAGFGSLALPKHGLTGTFDGRGHVIYNFSSRDGGLFGSVNGGTVKNVAVIGYKGSGSDGIFGESAIHNAKFDNIYISSTNDITAGAEIGMLVSDASKNIKVSNLLVEYYGKVSGSASVGSLIGGYTRSPDPANSQHEGFEEGAFENVYIISNVAVTQVGYNSVSKAYTVAWDGEYVDGVKNNGVYNRKINTGDADYPTAVAGIRRYTSSAKMVADKRNVNVSGFDRSVWTIVDGMPKYTNAMNNFVTPFVGQYASFNGYVQIPNGTKADVVLTIDGTPVADSNYTVSLVSGDCITLEGKTVTATTVSNEVAVLQIVDAKYGTYVLEVDVVTPVTEYAGELYYSTGTNEFFKDGELIDLATIFGKDVELVKAYDKEGNLLTIGADNKINGVKTSATEIASDTLTLMTANEAVKVNVKVAGAVINEAEDLKVFMANADTQFAVNGEYDTYFENETDLRYDGYYVLVKNIDASSLGVYDWKNGHTVHLDKYTGSSRMDYLANNYWSINNEPLHGFMGTLDGNGYTISNLTVKGSNGGFLGYIVGGTVKNIAFTNCKSTDGGYGIIAYSSFANAKFENVYINTASQTAGKDYSPLGGLGHTVSANNVVIVDNASIAQVSAARTYGSFTNDARRWNVAHPATFVAGKTSDIYVVSTIPFNATVALNTTDVVAVMDAEYVDGKAVTLLSSGENMITEGADRTVKGAKRYTSTANMTADASSNNFATFNSNIWEVVSGIPRFKSVDKSELVQIAVNGNEIAGSYDVLLGESINVSLKLDGNEYTANDLVVTSSATDVASVSGAVVTANATTAGASTITLAFGGKTLTFALNVCEPILIANGAEVKDTYTIRLAKDATFSFEFNGSAVAGNVTLEGESSAFEIDGTKITASGSVTGSAEVTAKIVAEKFTVTKTFKVVVDAPVIMANGAEFAENTLSLATGESATITLAYQGEDVTAPITLAGEADCMSVDGATVIADDTVGGQATVTITCDGMTLTFKVAVLTTDVEELTVNPYFSAYDGIFFNENMSEVVSLADLINNDDEVIAATDANGNKLVVTATGEILGLETVNTGITDTSLNIYTATKGYTVSVKAYTLIIDQATDMAYFSVKDIENYNKGQTAAGYSYIDFAKGDCEFDGYYIMANDIDFLAESYVHDFDHGVGVNFGSHGLAATDKDTKGGLRHIGLTGTFDGNGYTMNNVTVGESGLFGLIPGTFKNTKIVLNQKYLPEDAPNAIGHRYYGKYQGSGAIAHFVLASGTISDVYMEVNGSMNAGWGTMIIATEFAANSTFKNVVVNYPDNGSDQDYTGFGGPAFASLEKANVENFFYVSPYPMNLTSAGYYKVDDGAVWGRTSFYKVKQDARYLDGVDMGETTGTGDTFYQIYHLGKNASLKDHEIVVADTNEKVTEYSYTTISGAKRYTSMAKLTSDATANASLFANFNANVWDFVDGIPMFARDVQENAKVFLGANEFTEDTLTTSVNSSYEFTVRANGVVLNGYNVEEIAETKILKIVDKVIIPTAQGQTQVKISYRNFSKVITLEVEPELITLTDDYLFSANEGLFYKKGEAFTLTEVVGDADFEVVTATDKDGNVLTYDADKDVISGVKTSSTELLENSILVYSGDLGYEIKVKCATLVIDDAEDLKVFQADASTVESPTEANGWEVVFANEDDIKVEGYYVLAKNIDASSLGTYSYTNGHTISWGHAVTRMEYLGDTGWCKGAPMHGFLGTLDGNGYTISNLTTEAAGGLLGYINAGTVKNIGFVNCGTSDGRNGFLAYGAIKGATFSDVYVSTSSIAPGVGYSPLVGAIGYRQFRQTNVVVIDNSQDLYTLNRVASSLTNDVARHSASEAPTFGYSVSNIQKFTNYYIVSKKPLHGVGTGTEYTAKMDARYVDGSQVTLTASGMSYIADGADMTVEGVYRYTSYENFVKDAANRNFTGFSSSMWTMVGGVPCFTSAISIANATVFFNDITTSNNAITLEANKSYEVTFRQNGFAIDKSVSVALKSGTAVSISGSTVVAGANKGTAVVTATCDGVSKDITVTVDLPLEEYQGGAVEFSALDGVLDYDKILGTATPTITKATDANGNELTIGSNNEILGLETRGDAVTETSINLYTPTKNVKIPVNAYTLIIDEAKDFENFTIKGTTTGVHDWANATWDLNGYYILGKDIDCTGYTHSTMGGNTWSLSGIGIGSLTHAMFGNRGLTGTFDGNGYSINNFASTGGNSLLGVVNGGTVKNVAITNTAQSSGALASWAVKGATFQDIYHNHKVPVSTWGNRAFLLGATEDVAFNRIFIEYNYGNNWNGWVGPIMSSTSLSQFTDSFYQSSYHTVLQYSVSGSVAYKTLSDCETCSGTGLVAEVACTTCSGTGKTETPATVNASSVLTKSKYVNGQLSESTHNIYYGNSATNISLTLQEGVCVLQDGSSAYDVTLIDGIRTYSNALSFKNDASAELQQILARYPKNIWTIVNNRPVFASTIAE